MGRESKKRYGIRKLENASGNGMSKDVNSARNRYIQPPQTWSSKLASILQREEINLKKYNSK
jgi:hypothetical protein